MGTAMKRERGGSEVEVKRDQIWEKEDGNDSVGVLRTREEGRRTSGAENLGMNSHVAPFQSAVRRTLTTPWMLPTRAN